MIQLGSLVSRRVIALTAIAVVAASGSLPGQEPPLATVMERVGAYSAAFQHQLSNIVAEERYVQDITRMNLAPGRFATVSHRELRSDVLLVQPSGADRYVEFRDVFEVDGAPVRDRQDRLTTLFLNPTPSAEAQIQRINRESARYNIGNIERTINTPTLALLFLIPENQSRFRFTRSTKAAPALGRSAGTSRGAVPGGFTIPAEAWAVEYEEVQHPTLIRSTRGVDLPAHGRIWAEPATGRVLVTELIAEDPTVRATIDVAYLWDPLVGLMVPAEMRERYEGRRDGAVIEGDATYGTTRRFQVQATERVASDQQTRADVPAVTIADRPSAPAVDAATQDSPDKNADTSRQPDTPRPANAVKDGTPATSQELPKPQTFITGTELVLVDFVVTDKADRPVRGLSAKDFVVKEDGKERPIVSFEAFAGADPRGSTIGRKAPDSPITTAPPSPAATVLLVDDGQLSPEQAARLRPGLNALVARVGGPSARLMIVAPASRVSVLGVLPGHAADLAAAADRIVGQRVEDHSNFPVADAEALAIARGDVPTLGRVTGRFLALNPELTAEQADMFVRERANMLAHDARARRAVMYDAALACLDWLGNQPGRHGLIVVSSGFASDPDDSKYYEVVTRSLRVNAPIHFLDARGLPGIGRYQGVETGPALSRGVDEGPFGWAQAADGASGLADDTGGLSIGKMNDMQKGLDRLLDTMTTYYMLAYQPAAHEKPGYRTIKVEVRTRGLHVRARRGYVSGLSVKD